MFYLLTYLLTYMQQRLYEMKVRVDELKQCVLYLAHGL